MFLFRSESIVNVMIPNDDTCIRRQEIFYDLKTPENLITLIIII